MKIEWLSNYLQFDPESFFSQEDFDKKKKLIVCPSPLMADAMRGTIESQKIATTAEVITISKFMDLISQLRAEDLDNAKPIKFLRKSELLFEMGIAAKRIDGDISFESFSRIFNIYTDLRGYTLNRDTYNSMIEHFDDDESKILRFFNDYMTVRGLIDEHQAYKNLEESILSIEDTSALDDCSVLMWGFVHLTGVQIDFLKALARRVNIKILLPRSLKACLKDRDWPFWCSNEENIEEQSIIRNENAFKVCEFNRMELSRYIETLTKDKGHSIVYLGLKDDVQFKNILAVNNLRYKIQRDIFEDELSQLVLELEEKKDLDISKELQPWIVSHLRESSRDENYRRVKILELYLKNIEKYLGLTDKASLFGSFERKLFKNTITLDLPRLNEAVLLLDSNDHDLYNIKNLAQSLNGNKPIVVSIFYDPKIFQDDEDKYDWDLQKLLLSIGPIRSKRLESHVKFELIKTLNNKEDTIFLLEEGCYENIPLIKELFGDKPEWVKIEKSSIDSSQAIDISLDSVGEKLQLSATKIQTFIDCPRKYYFHYIQKLNRYVVPNCNLEPADVGTLAHASIKRYFTKNTQHSVEIVTKKVLADYYDNRHIKASKIEKYKFEQQVLELTQTGVNFVKPLLNAVTEFEFEYRLKARDGHTGSIDFFGRTKDGFILVDFKKSAAGIPSITELLKGSKVQLGYYLYALDLKENDKIIMVGYVNLEAPNDSLLFGDSKSHVWNLLNEEFSSASEKIVADEWKAMMDQRINELVIQIKSEKEFLPRPTSVSVCTYCSFSQVCQRR